MDAIKMDETQVRTRTTDRPSWTREGQHHHGRYPSAKQLAHHQLGRTGIQVTSPWLMAHGLTKDSQAASQLHGNQLASQGRYPTWTGLHGNQGYGPSRSTERQTPNMLLMIQDLQVPNRLPTSARLLHLGRHSRVQSPTCSSCSTAQEQRLRVC